ncbi:MAG: HlyC/CorC family transporter [Melioribacteraceae bacterium]|nr:HlyC/CorC family transporter [Melioribacteraceae bacterium]
MEVDWFYSFSLLAVFLLLSAFFSGSEVALFSLDKKKLKEIKEGKGLINKYIINLIKAPRRLLVTILLGNTIFNVGASIISVALALKIADSYNINVDFILLLQIILLTVLVLIFGEITPKIWATKKPYQFAKVIIIPLYWVSVLIYPVAAILTDLLKLITSRIKFDKSKTAILSSEISDLAGLSREKGTIEDDEHELIHGIVSFKTISVREVMTPRVDVTAVSSDTDFDSLLNLINESGHSRIPLYKNDLDDIIGIIYAKDLLPFLNNSETQKNISLRKISRNALFIPESKLISDTMRDFQQKNRHMGIVVDEYGGTSGIVTLEDILEEIVGEIRDEYDNEENEITELENGSYLVLGKVSIDEINELLASNLSSENDDYDTVGGFIFNKAAIIPDEGFNFEHDCFKFTVKEVDNKRISKVLIDRLEDKSR